MLEEENWATTTEKPSRSEGSWDCSLGRDGREAETLMCGPLYGSAPGRRFLLLTASTSPGVGLCAFPFFCVCFPFTVGGSALLPALPSALGRKGKRSCRSSTDMLSGRKPRPKKERHLECKTF